MGLSDQIIDAIAIKVNAATGIATASIFKEPRASASVTVSPYATVFTDGAWSVEELRYRQLRRTIPVIGLVVYSMGTGLTLAAAVAHVRAQLDAIEAGILADSTLGGIVQRAVPNLSSPQILPNSKLVFGPFAVTVQAMARMTGAP